jgi:FkbM family methyltransferase
LSPLTSRIWKVVIWLASKKGLRAVPVPKLDEKRRELREIARSLARKTQDLSLIERLTKDFNAAWVVEFLPISRSQLRQDLFVLAAVGPRAGGAGYFVEFGATDGLDLSNSWLLEDKFGWSGLLAEPATRWHESLVKNRSCAIDLRCVWSQTGETIVFNETTSGELSTIDQFSDSDRHAASRKDGSKYNVETVSLADLLKSHDAPKKISYLSIDTEGSEFEILSSFDFNEYEIDVITVEHNFTSAREKIQKLLESHGYCRLYEDLSEWDDWYVHDRIVNRNS